MLWRKERVSVCLHSGACRCLCDAWCVLYLKKAARLGGGLYAHEQTGRTVRDAGDQGGWGCRDVHVCMYMNE
jgi:hypothetical protein